MLDSPGEGGKSVPASVWVGTQPVWEGASVVNFIDDLTQSAPLVPSPPLVIVAVSADPPAVVTVHGLDELPLTSTVSVHVVVETRTTWTRRV